MSITIDLPNRVYECLEKQAQVLGTSVSETVSRLIEEIESVHLSAVVRQMQAEGLFADPPAVVPHAPVDFQPIVVQGKPLSEVILRSGVDERLRCRIESSCSGRRFVDQRSESISVSL